MVYRRTRHRSFAAALLAATLVWSAHGTARAAPADDARTILDATGTQGGLIVHLGCGDGRLTAARGRLYLSMNGGKVFCMGAKPWTESRRRKNDHEKLLTS